MKKILYLAIMIFTIFSSLSCAGCGKKTESESKKEQAAVRSVATNEKPMIKYIDTTPVEVLREALKNKDAASLETVLKNGLTPDYELDGKKVRDIVKESGDAEMIKAVEEADKYYQYQKSKRDQGIVELR